MGPQSARSAFQTAHLIPATVDRRRSFRRCPIPHPQHRVSLLFLLALLVFSADPPPDRADAVPTRTAVSLPDTVATLYAQKDRAGLERLQSRTASVSDDLLLRYRLYPLARQRGVLENLPAEVLCRSARDYAILSALWAYRLAEAPVWRLPEYGRRVDSLMRRGREMDAGDPFVLLVEGQSLLYRPGIFGGSAEGALERFVQLRDLLRDRERRRDPVAGLPAIEAEIWVWYTLRRLGRDGTDRLRDRLLAQNPPPLYRDFLLDPP